MTAFIEWITQTVPNWIVNAGRILAATFKFWDIVDILLVALIIYYLITLLRHSRGSQLMRGILILLVAYVLANELNLKTITFLLDKILQFGLIALVVIFQPEIRRALEQMGRSKLIFGIFRTKVTSEQRSMWLSAVVTICDSAEHMAKDRTGALIVIERQSHLAEIASTGTALDAQLTAELLETIFYEGSPLHDGAVLVKDARVSAAGCLLPVSQSSDIGKEMGTRHRAAIGLSENSDALVIVVSEETGIISLAKDGVIIRRLDRAKLYRILENDLVPRLDEEEDKSKTFFGRIFKK